MRTVAGKTHADGFVLVIHTDAPGHLPRRDEVARLVDDLRSTDMVVADTLLVPGRPLVVLPV
ncbi:MAG: hypothetical protein R2737_18410 [Candidatus Nanopelagicales bacterium]